MASPTIKVGVTVNLGGYESLRVEVEGAEWETAPSVLENLDQTLASIQRRATSETVQDAIARFRKATLGREGLLPEGPAEPKAPPATKEKWEPTITKDSLPKKSETEGKSYVGKADPAAVVRLDQPIPSVAEQVATAVATCIKPPAPEDPEPAPAGSPLAQTAGPICEACGAVVTKSQEKLSQLFMSKTLCKKCQAEASA